VQDAITCAGSPRRAATPGIAAAGDAPLQRLGGRESLEIKATEAFFEKRGLALSRLEPHEVGGPRQAGPIGPDGAQQGDRQRRASPGSVPAPPHRAAPGWRLLLAAAGRLWQGGQDCGAMAAHMATGRWRGSAAGIVIADVGEHQGKAPGKPMSLPAQGKEQTGPGRSVKKRPPGRPLLRLTVCRRCSVRVSAPPPAGRFAAVDTHRHHRPGRRHGACLCCQSRKVVRSPCSSQEGGGISGGARAATATEHPGP